MTYAAPAAIVEQSIEDFLSHIRRIQDEIAVMRQSSTPLRVGDTGIDTLWSRHCEVIRIGDRHYEGGHPQLGVGHVDTQSLLQTRWQARTSPLLILRYVSPSQCP